MIIACYAGTGKSTFARKYQGETIDLCSMPFSWILPEQTDRETECEDMKAAPYLLGNPAFPDNYIAAILEAKSKYKYILIPTINSVLEALYNVYKTPYVLCYPQLELKEEYRNRYINRGNTEDFLNVFIEQWEDRIELLMEDGNGSHIVLEPGEFLTDVKDEIDGIAKSAGTNFKNISLADEELKRLYKQLYKQVEIKLKMGCIWFFTVPRLPDYYFPVDLREAGNRNWVFDIGKICYERDIDVRVDNVQDVETFYDHLYRSDPDKIWQFGSRQEVMDYIQAANS